jgi:hypothetical protein
MKDENFIRMHNFFCNYGLPMREIFTDAWIGMPFDNACMREGEEGG